MEADYSNRLASPLVASSGETSPSPRIRCGKIKLPCQDVSSWAVSTWELQEYDTTRFKQSTKNLPHWKMQGYDVQNGYNESMGVVG